MFQEDDIPLHFAIILRHYFTNLDAVGLAGVVSSHGHHDPQNVCHATSFHGSVL